MLRLRKYDRYCIIDHKNSSFETLLLLTIDPVEFLQLSVLFFQHLSFSFLAFLVQLPSFLVSFRLYDLYLRSMLGLELTHHYPDIGLSEFLVLSGEFLLSFGDFYLDPLCFYEVSHPHELLLLVSQLEHLLVRRGVQGQCDF